MIVKKNEFIALYLKTLQVKLEKILPDFDYECNYIEKAKEIANDD